MNWEPWTGCQPYSEGCAFCYFYGPHSKRHEENTVTKTPHFNKPLSVKPGRTLATCFATDFLIDQADHLRPEAWKIIKSRPDITFLILTKRIDRLKDHLPPDWNQGYPNIYLGVTVENQKEADHRLPIFMSIPLKRRFIATSPLLTPIDLTPYLATGKIEQVTAAGESAPSAVARPCNHDWIISLHAQCKKYNTKFWFKSTGTNFIQNGVLQKINPWEQAKTAKLLQNSFSSTQRKTP